MLALESRCKLVVLARVPMFRIDAWSLKNKQYSLELWHPEGKVNSNTLRAWIILVLFGLSSKACTFAQSCCNFASCYIFYCGVYSIRLNPFWYYGIHILTMRISIEIIHADYLCPSNWKQEIMVSSTVTIWIPDIQWHKNLFHRLCLPDNQIVLVRSRSERQNKSPKIVHPLYSSGTLLF